MLDSRSRGLLSARLPFKGRRIRGHAFDLSKPVMPEGYEDYAATVVSLCAAAGATSGTAYLTVDERHVKAGTTHRRGGPHVDGHFVGGQWRHKPGGQWIHRDEFPRMAVIVASSVPGTKVYEGRFTGEPKEDGDVSHIADQFDAGHILAANMGFYLSPDCVHESVVQDRDVDRSFLRIALPV